MSKKKDEGAAEVLQAAQEPQASVEQLDMAEAAKRVALAEVQLAESRKLQEQVQAEARRKNYEEDVARRKRENAQRTIPVIVQQRRDRPVRIRELVIPCRTPVLVNRRELRKLEGLRTQGRIQLVVGALEKQQKLEA